VKQIESGQIQRELAGRATSFRRDQFGREDPGGVNKFKVKEEERDLEVYKTDPRRSTPAQRLKATKAGRDKAKVEAA